MVQEMGGSTVPTSMGPHSLRARYHLGWAAGDLRGPILVSVAYFLGAESAFVVGTLSDRIFAPFWPPNVILFAVLLRAPVSRWWLYVVAVVPAHVLAELHIGMQLVPMAVALATNCMVAVLCALAVRQQLEGAPWFGTRRVRRRLRADPRRRGERELSLRLDAVASREQPGISHARSDLSDVVR